MLLPWKSCAFSAKNNQVQRPEILCQTFTHKTSVIDVICAGKNKNISISFIRLAVGVLLLLLVVTFTGCIFFAGSDTGIAVPNLTIKGAPSDITALSLRITGPGMAPVESYYSSVPSSITVEIPAGVDRQFELIAYIGPSNPSAATSFKGTATVDLDAGETQNITLNMIVNETKLVIPDNRNNRIVQIDDMAGSGWIEKIQSGFSPQPNGFVPYDIDFDSQGRIYIANYVSSAGGHKVMRIDNISNSNYDIIVIDSGAGAGFVCALAVDRNNNYVYYATSTALYRCNLDGTNEIQRNISVSTIRGLEVDEDGLLYISGNDGSDRIFQYDPITENITASYSANINTAWDVLVKPPYIYVANRDGADGYKIIQLDADLGFIAAYGDQSTAADDIPGNFYGPKRFIAILNRKICILDEGSQNEPSGFEGDRLISMGDITGTDWTLFGQTGGGTGQFRFYWAC